MKLILAVAVLMNCSSAANALEAYEVTGVAPGDTLSLREEPSEGGKPSDWKEVERIPHDAKEILGTGRSVRIGTQRWIEAVYNGKTGWANLKHLQGVHGGGEASPNFHCSGTEPFWSISIGARSATYESPDDKSGTMGVDATIVAQGRPGIPVLYRMSGPNGLKMQAAVSQQEWCSDGMSDYDYAFEILLSDDHSLRQGCCSLSR